MRDLDHLKDSIVVFTSYEESMNLSPSSSSSAATRVPLREVSTQLSAHSKSLETPQDTLKLDNTYLSPTIVSKSVVVRDENQDGSPRFQAMSQAGKYTLDAPSYFCIKI